MAPVLRLGLLGAFQATWRGEPLRSLDPQRLQGLVAYLVLRAGVPQARHHVAFTFWPDSPEAQARTNLRQLIHLLRHALPKSERFLAADRRTLMWRGDAPAVVDVHELEAAWHEAEEALASGDQARSLAAARRAADLYTGDLLPACYDEWIEPERARLRGRALTGFARLVELLEADREYAEALRYTGRLLHLDPFREESHQAAIRLHLLTGEPAGAMRAYRACAELFERELGIEPGHETQALLERVRRAEPATGIPAAPRAPDTATRLLGRRAEWDVLTKAWAQAEGGAPGVVLVAGEPGIGKTRLAEAFVDWAERQGVIGARARCYAAEGLLAYGPVAQWLRAGPLHERAAGLDPVWRAELSRLLPELTPEPAGQRHEPGAVERWHRLRLFEALARAAVGDRHPLILLLDDLQWCDGDTLEWLHFLLRYDHSAPLLVVTTLRLGETTTDERLGPWLVQLGHGGLLNRIELGPLGPQEAGRLAAATAGRDLEPAQLEALYAETEGNPLFVLETVRMWQGGPEPDAAGSRARAPGHDKARRTPEKVHAVIRARLAQLSPDARELAELAATVGRDFSSPVLREAEGSEARVADALDELLERHLVRERGGDRFDFTHDKIREVAYQGLSSPRRALLHGRIAAALAAAHARAPRRVAGEIARHLERAGRGVEAIPHYQRAAREAMVVFAHGEAGEYLRRALDLLAETPPSRERAEQELELRTSLGAALVVSDHYSGARVWETYNRARELCAEIDRPPSPPILRALALASLMRSRLGDVLELGRALLHAAERDRTPMLQVEAHYVLGVVLYWQGRLASSRAHLERALTRYDPDRAREHLALYTQDPWIVCTTRLALTLWHLGLPGTAHRLCLDAIARAEALGHPFSLAYARYFGAWVLIELGDTAATRRQVSALVRESGERGFETWAAMGRLLEGWLLAGHGHHDRGIAAMREAAGEYEAMEVDLGFPYQQYLYARACRDAGRTAEAADALDQGIRMAGRTGETFWDAELHRFAGELALVRGAAPDDARRRFEQALEIAAAQGARTLELRAALSLARLAREHGRPAGVLERLASIADNFTDAQESAPELIEARELLAVYTGSPLRTGR